MSEPLAAAYSATGGTWQAGPGRIYDRLAVELVARCPTGVAGGAVLDLGAGTGAASRAAAQAGAATVVAVDLALGMLAHDAGRRPPGVVADLRELPFPAATFDAVVAAFSLNHLPDPVAGLIEAARVLVPGGALVASAYAADDTHPVKAAVEAACADQGWTTPAWYEAVRRDAVPRLADPDRAAAAACAAGLTGATAEVVRIAFAELSPADLVAWRLGMAQVADFLDARSPADRRALEADALERLGPAPPVLVRSFVTLAWRRPG